MATLDREIFEGAKKYTPIDCGVLLAIEKPKAVVTDGGIELAGELDTEKIRRFRIGIVVAMGAAAFDYLEDGDRKVEIGDKVGFLKQAGMVLDPFGEEAKLTESGKKKPIYRLVNDKDIRVVIDEEQENE